MKSVTVKLADLLNILRFSETKVGAPAGNVIAAIEAEFPPETVFKRCYKCGKFLPATEEYFDEEERMADALTNKCIPCRRSYISKWKRDTRRDARLRKQNPGYDADQAEIARVRADYLAEKAAEKSAEAQAQTQTPEDGESSKVGRPRKPIISREEGLAIQAAGKLCG